MLKRKGKKVTPAVTAEYIEYLRRCGFKHRAAEAVGVSYQTMRNAENADPVFAQQVEDALDEYAEGLEQEADRRGKDGIDKPIFYKGERIDVVKDYSDQLLMFRLKALKPEKYRERADLQTSGNVTVELVQFGQD